MPAGTWSSTSSARPATLRPTRRSSNRPGPSSQPMPAKSSPSNSPAPSRARSRSFATRRRFAAPASRSAAGRPRRSNRAPGEEADDLFPDGEDGAQKARSKAVFETRLTAAETFRTRSAYVPKEEEPNANAQTTRPARLRRQAPRRNRNFPFVRGDEGRSRPQV